MKNQRKLSILIASTLCLAQMSLTTVPVFADEPLQSLEEQDLDVLEEGPEEEIEEENTYAEETVSPDLQADSTDGQEENYDESAIDPDGNTFGNINYTVNGDGTVTITGYDGSDTGQLIIPSTIEGKTVTKIKDYAFKGKKGFSGELNLPDTIIEIGSSAFYGCSGLSGLKLPANLTKIENYAFENCIGISGNITIPAGITSFGSGVFSGCKGITSLTLTPGLSTLGRSTFKNCVGIKNELVIPNSLLTIPSEAFYGCSAIPSVKIGSGVENIGDSAFQKCSGIRTLDLGSKVEIINDYAFRDCSAISGYVIIPDTVTTIKSYAFYNCTSFTGLYLPEGLASVGNYAFENCKSVTGDVVIPSSLADIGSSSFNGFGTGVSLTLSEGVARLGSSAFKKSGLMGKLVIPSTLTTVPDDAFRNCTGITSLEIKSGVTTIGDNAFRECTGITGNTVFPTTITEIGSYAFSDCVNITGFSLPDSLTTIKSYAFNKCNGVTGNFTLPASVTSIGYDAFYGFGKPNACTLTLPEGLLYLSNSLFSNTGFNGTLVVPSTIRKIPDSCFKNCQYFTALEIKAGVEEIGDSAFRKGGYTGNLNIPNTVRKIGSYAFGDCSALNGTLTIPAISSLSSTAFNGLYNIDTIVNNSGTTFKGSCFINNDSYFIKGSEKVKKDGTIGSGTYVRYKAPVEEHNWEQKITKATPDSDGRIYKKCSICGLETDIARIPKASGYMLSASSYTYDGKAKMPSVTVTDSTGKTITSANYTVSYSGNTNAGTGHVIVTFMGDSYTGRKDVSFTINKATNSLKVKGKTTSIKYSKLKNGKQTLSRAKVISITKKGQGKMSYTISSAKKNNTSFKKYFSINKSSGKITVKKGLKRGTYKVKIKVKAKGNSNYKASKAKAVTFTLKVK